MPRADILTDATRGLSLVPTAGVPAFAILASGRGSNAEALMNAFAAGRIRARLVGVIANVDGAEVLNKAIACGVPTRLIAHKGLKREEHEEKLFAVLNALGAEHLLLAGYMRVLSPWLLSRFRGRIVNIHPSLLPEFPGLHGAERQFRAKRSVVGATVHYVNNGVDTGEVILQGSIEPRGDEDEQTLVRRILFEVEHVIYARAVRLVVERLGVTDAS
ncbi:MAG: phosphoribosylglycinamide formyltransferase [Clostridia bacterium]|nr:phosphoribosylglycinamide formyltransferase [Deltaproteobacteria bacterium]